MTDRNDNRTPGRFERIGKLRKGGPKRPHPSKPGKFLIGVELEYFRFTSDDSEVRTAFNDAYGDMPVRIRCILPFASAEENFATWREAWVAGGLEHRCDGETQYLWRRPDGQMSHEPRKCEPGADGKFACKPVGRLLVVIPELLEHGYVGYVTMETHSINDLVNISAGLHAAEDMVRSRALGLRGVYCVLGRAKAAISTPSGGSARATRDKWLVSLTLDSEWVRAQLDQARLEHLHPAMALLMPGGETVNPATGETMPPAGIDDHLEDGFETDDTEENGDGEVEPEPGFPGDQSDARPTPPISDRPWSRDRVIALLRDYVQQTGQAGEIPPTEESAHLTKRLLTGLVGGKGKQFINIVFRNSDFGGLSQAKCDAITRVWINVDAQGHLNVTDQVALAEALAVIGDQACETQAPVDLSELYNKKAGK